MISTNLTDRDLRQRELVPPQRLGNCHAVVIGVGAIGRQVAMQLAALGIPKLTLFDDDHVSAENLAAQGYWPADLGQHKVVTTAAVCRAIHPQLDVRELPQRFRRSDARTFVSSPAAPIALFAAVDSIVTRQLIWEAAHSRVDFFVDGRMNGEVIRVLAVARPAQDRSYPASLFDASAAYRGSCTARSTIYAASIAAGLMLTRFAHWLRALPVEPDTLLNLLACEMSAR